MDFRERLSNSLHYSMISVEALLQEIIQLNGSYQQNYLQFQNMKIEPNEDRIDYSQLCDNRDLNVMLRWDPMYTIDNQPFYESVKEVEKESFIQDTELLQIRSNLLRLVAASIDLIHLPSLKTNTKEQNGHDSPTADESFKSLIATWRELFNRVRKLNYRPSSSQFLVNLLPSRLHLVVELPYEEVFSALGDFVYNLWIGSEKTKGMAKKLQESLINVKNFVEKLEAVDEKREIFFYKNLQASIVGCVEV